ncbi:MAG: glycoside hydrolase family protein [Candidatus Omnitrophota bacterium]|jgi:lysozyme
MNIERLKQTLIKQEGTGPIIKNRLMPYRCTSGKLTIGIGRNIEDNGISQAEAEFMLENDIAEAIELCKRLFPVFDELNDVRQEVLVNMMFNMGYNKFSGFKRFIAATNAKDFKRAAAEMENSTWYEQVGKKPGQRAYDLKMMMLTGYE